VDRRQRGGRDPPGAFRDFGLSVQIPAKDGDTLTFKALQTYTGGEVVRWIGAEGSDNPAPIVTVAAAQEEEAASHNTTPAQTPAPAASSTDAAEEDSGDGLAIVALIVGLLGLLAGAAGLIVARRATPTEGGQHREQDAGRADQRERPCGEHEAVGALLALLAGGTGASAALDVAHAFDHGMASRGSGQDSG
jgi:hypothetical protein